MPFYDAGDAAIYYEIEGEGPPVVLMHGYALNGAMWELQRPVLSKYSRVITADLRGFGKSSCGKSWSGTVMARDVTGMIESLDLSDVSILGFSMSGPVALRVALELPEIVSRLILVSSVLPSSGRDRAKKESDLQRRELDVLRLRGVEAWAEAVGLLRGPMVDSIFRKNPEAGPLWNRMMARHNPDYLFCMMTARETTSPSENLRPRLKEIKQPALIVVGARDKQFIDSGHYLNRNIPNSRLEIVSGAGHMVNLEEPETFNKIVSGFIRDF
jgi:pimeloyl-ACP methyl ester carboxylesterase